MAKILVVDDEGSIREMLTRFLSASGHQVQSVENGEEALAIVEQDSPEMVILDMYLPGMDGLEILRQLRQKRYGRAVIMLSGCQDERMLEKALDLGSVEFMRKPFDFGVLATTVEAGCTLATIKNGKEGDGYAIH